MITQISAVINTLNEEKNLPFALRSVRQWVDEIVVVDMHSTDRTVEIARSFGARVYLHPGPGFRYAPRSFALDRASSEWILVIDADELVPIALSRELRQLADAGAADVVRIPRTNYLLGMALRHTGWGAMQDKQMRFFRKGFAIGSSEAHRDFTPVQGARVKVLRYLGDNAMIHFNYVDSSQFIDKLNRYTSIQAAQAWQKGKQPSVPQTMGRAAVEFLHRYFINRGFLDGWRGFYLSLCMAFYRIVLGVKLQETKAAGSRELIESQYLLKAEEILNAYSEPKSVAVRGDDQNDCRVSVP